MDTTKLSAIQIAGHIRSGSLTATDVAKAFINRIKKYEDTANAFLYFNADEVYTYAQKTQTAIDEMKSQGKELPPLAGVPIAIKDNICTKDAPTTCASKMLQSFVSPYDATVISLIKSNLLIPLGKTNMDEFAMGSSTESSAFKKTVNPWNTDCVPGGSSGGSAASIAYNMSPLALGSDTGGSIRQPASFCGITGLKPTYGRVSRYGLVAFASSLDQIGPMAKDAESCSALFDIISSHDERDSSSKKSRYAKTHDSINDSAKPVIAIVEEFMCKNISEDVKNIVLDSAEKFKRMGCTIVSVSLPSLRYALSAYCVISSAEASSNLARYDGIRYGYRTKEASDIQALYKKTRSEGFGNEVRRRIMLGTYALSSGYFDRYYAKAIKARNAIKKDFAEVFRRVDLILSPAAVSSAFGFSEKSSTDMFSADYCTVAANLAGLPAVSFPAGFDTKGLPIGAQLTGSADLEGLLLSCVHAFQKITDFHTRTPEAIDD